MSYYLYPPFFGVEPQTSFDKAWEVFCCELLNLKHDTQSIRRRRPPDLGADLIWNEQHTIYQCKATGKATKNGEAGQLDINEILASIERAKENQQQIGWEKYILCINVDLTGNQDDKIRKALPGIEILSRADWVKLCQQFDREVAVTSRFHYTSHSLSEPIWNIPYTRNPFFTGREEVLEQIYENLNTGITTALTQPQAVNGLGGIGKTQCAVEFAYRHQQEYFYIFWVNASTHETLTTSYIDLASRLHLSTQNELEPDKIVEAVKQWLHVQNNWLLIADNAEDLNVTSTFLPATNTGHILLTTREPAGRRFSQSVEIKEMEEEEGILMLLHRTGLLTPNASIHQADPQDREQAQTIVREMGGLPLALDQAGAYIEENRSTLVEYLETYKSKKEDLLKRRGRYGSDHPDTVATTWSLNFEQVKQNNPLAADVMRTCAFLAPDDIPEDIFVRRASKLKPLLRTLINEPTLLRDAVGELSRFSLVRRNPSKRTLSIHRLVQVVVKSSLKKDEQKKWVKRVVYTLKNTFPTSSDITSWEVCQQYLSHALVCFDLIEQYNITSIEAASLLQHVANYQSERASYDTVVTIEQMYQHALTIVEQHHPQHDVLLASVLYDFARFYYDKGDYEQAELLLQRAITINEQDADELNIARNHNLLAACYYAHEEYEQAERLLGLALVIHEHSLDSNRLNTAMSLNNLAVLYYVQAEYEQAEKLHQRALAIHESLSGPNHPNTAMSLNNLAALYYVQGKHEQAETLYQRALAIYEHSLGSKHPSTAMSLNNLAELYHTQEEYEQAETLYQRALAICEHSLGPDHPSTVTVRNNYIFFQSQMRKRSSTDMLSPS